MNNEQFRRLLFDNSPTSSKPKSGSSTSPTGNGQSQSQPQSLPSTGYHASSHAGSTQGPGGALGSRMRSITKPDFARQQAEYRRDAQNPHPSKKFKSSAAPKGTKLPSGYQDRAARLRELESAGDAGQSGSGAEEKLQVLEERFKKGLIDESTFLKLQRDLGVGGDLSTTHMVKGLDWDLLRKVRAGEDVEKREGNGDAGGGDAEGRGSEERVPEGDGEGEEVDVDEEFDRVLDGKENAALPSAPKEREKKHGTMAPPPAPVSAQRKTRDEILRELKASRAAAEADATAHEPALGSRFKKIGDSKVEKKRFIEHDENGRRREVLLITDAEGRTKRKTRWLDKPGTTAALATPNKKAKPLGMEIPAEIAVKAKAARGTKEEDDDIFEGVGADYNPLGDAGSDEESSESEEDDAVATKVSQKAPATEMPSETAKRRNYFATTTTQEEVESDRANPLTKDPVLLAALKRAASLRQASTENAPEGEEVDKDTLLRRKKFLEEARRREELDAMDMDYGFGGSRIDDDEDEEAVVLETRGGTKRKRGPKKKKGDKDSAADVLGVLEWRKKS
ncbi:uncharacterized protein BJX67DRAFT_377588 [Aspergillus lucknowensis]|uniref:RED-like N-terminal domain-containing protein n=1 Tax=Aspergillus lucknowensis TaxID=176173 RepID=A0ABR4M2D5_9EURO